MLNGKESNILQFADKIAVVAETREDLQAILNAMDQVLCKTHQCSLKRKSYHPLAFSIYATYQCYYYLTPELFKPDARIRPSPCNISISTTGPTNVTVPCYKPPDGSKPFPFNRTDPRVLEVVSSTLRRQEDAKKWLSCSQAADDCCKVMLGADRARRGKQLQFDGRCPPQWDIWYCWPDGGSPGTFVQGDCPDYIYSNNAPRCQHHQTKECFANGTWRDKTDYSTCSVAPQTRMRTVYHVIVLAISLITTIPALVIFFSYRKLRVMPVILHRTLIMTIAARNSLTIISSTTVILSELRTSPGVMEENGVPCRVLATFELLAANAAYACMLLEGLHLHRRIAAAFQSTSYTTPAIVAAIALTVLPVIAWSVVMATLQDSNCWYVDNDKSGYQWINSGPRIAMLVVNTLLLIDIVRVMLTKLRSVNSASAGKLRMTAKATLYLMPLFGVQLLLTVVRPETTDCVAEQVYYFITYTMDGLQGFFVVLIYCFLNNEVKELLRRSLKVWCDKAGIRATKNTDLTSRRTTLLTTVNAFRPADEVRPPRHSLVQRHEDREPGHDPISSMDEGGISHA